MTSFCCPTLDGLQEMLATCNTFAKSHNLTFSIHENPVKSKTKCMAFLNNKRPLRELNLNDMNLPSVNSVEHLGVTVTNDVCRTSQDTMEKRGQYIAKNNDLMQEFYYACPTTISMLNDIYNTHFYGAPLWDLFSAPFNKLTKSWNVSHRIMYGLPRTTHRYLIEPISERSRITCSIWNRFLKFTRMLRESRKQVLNCVFKVIKFDCRSTTGRNLRKIMLTTGHDVYNKADIDFEMKTFYRVLASENWRIPIIKDILRVKHSDFTINNFNVDELDQMLKVVCCS
jgi:hypothetical protein